MSLSTLFEPSSFERQLSGFGRALSRSCAAAIKKFRQTNAKSQNNLKDNFIYIEYKLINWCNERFYTLSNPSCMSFQASFQYWHSNSWKNKIPIFFIKTLSHITFCCLKKSSSPEIIFHCFLFIHLSQNPQWDFGSFPVKIHVQDFS